MQQETVARQILHALLQNVHTAGSSAKIDKYGFQDNIATALGTINQKAIVIITFFLMKVLSKNFLNVWTGKCNYSCNFSKY